MPVHKPGRVLLHHIPLAFVRNRVAGGGRKGVDVAIALVPFIDFLIVLVVFLLMSFGSRELVAQVPDLKMPEARNTVLLEEAPIISVSTRVVTLNGSRVADTATLAQNPTVERIDALVQNLETAKRNWALLRPNQDFPGMVILQCDHQVDFRVIKKLMFSAAQAGYPNISFAVNKGGTRQ